MKTLKKVTAGFFLIIGLGIMILGTVDLVSSNKTQEDKDGALAAMVIFGVPATVFGGWLFRELQINNDPFILWNNPLFPQTILVNQVIFLFFVQSLPLLLKLV